MLGKDESALTCDMAETYGIYNLRALPVPMLATLAAGLRENSRIRMKASNTRATAAEALLAAILDRLTILVWRGTEDGVAGRNVPASVFDALMGREPEQDDSGDVCTFSSPEEFLAAWKNRR